ncbi:hypothetical protein BaRGS_00015970 [Batillaria attramentaria]|uniref:Uncharacterized protein n=1 Tax=Batillaria attramentaria TaxID=370345 RepID=A0ABD0L0A0_9CAEN
MTLTVCGDDVRLNVEMTVIAVYVKMTSIKEYRDNTSVGLALFPETQAARYTVSSVRWLAILDSVTSPGFSPLSTCTEVVLVCGVTVSSGTSSWGWRPAGM